MINLKLFLYIIIPIFISCSLNSDIDTTSQDNELMKKLDKGITLFESKKYTRALDDFNSIILNAIIINETINIHEFLGMIIKVFLSILDGRIF